MKAVGENKRCSKCQEWKHVGEFYRSKEKSDGLDTRCKPCSRAGTKQWRAKNAEKCAEYNKKWLAENPAKMREYARKSYWENRVKKVERSRQYHARNREKICEVMRERYRQTKAENPEKINGPQRLAYHKRKAKYEEMEAILTELRRNTNAA